VTDRLLHHLLGLYRFRRFKQGRDPELSGFEHVIVGEQEGGKVQGYHFWYKYYLDDGLAETLAGEHHFPGLQGDQIAFAGSHLEGDQRLFPESVTIAYKWLAPDYERKKMRPLFKRKGGFFVGCSVEGLMALGTVAAHLGAEAPRHAVIEGARYDMRVFLSPNRRHIRTFYPVFKGVADPTHPGNPEPPIPQPPTQPGTDGDVRIIAALINPKDHDPGNESVSSINLGPNVITLDGWSLQDKNGNRHPLDGISLKPGAPHTTVLPRNSMQLSNKGGSIELLNKNSVVHRVVYSKSQARAENRALIFT